MTRRRTVPAERRLLKRIIWRRLHALITESPDERIQVAAASVALQHIDELADRYDDAPSEVEPAELQASRDAAVAALMGVRLRKPGPLPAATARWQDGEHEDLDDAGGDGGARLPEGRGPDV